MSGHHAAHRSDAECFSGCRKGLRTNTSLVAETAQCFNTHALCLLIGYGAHAVCPYLAFETCRQWRNSQRYSVLADVLNDELVVLGTNCSLSGLSLSC